MPLIEFEGRLIDRDAQLRELDRADAEESLHFFLKKAWKYIDPAPFTDGWVIDALAEHLEAVADGDIRRLLINIPPRHSKPVATFEMISTQEFGLIPLRDVVPGMHVLTHKNRFRRVLAVHQQGVLPTLRLTTRKGRTVVAAGDHPFYTTDSWRELQHIRSDDRVGVVPQSDRLTSGRPTMSPETARLLGYLVGDGSCRGTPNITVADDPEAADIHHVVRAAGFVPTEQTYRMAQTGYMLRRIGIRAAVGQMKRPTKTSSGPVKQFMQRYGLWEKSSYTKRVPEDVMCGNENVISEFLGAYWACDGFITKKTAERSDHLIGCDSVSLDMLRDIQLLLLRLGIDSIIRRKVAKVKTEKQGDTYTSYSLTVSDQYNCWQFARRVCLRHTKDERLIPLRRANAPDFARDVVPDVVESVEPSDVVECMCLTVEEDQSFVVNGFAVHNSSICSVAFPAWIWAQEYESPTSGPGVPIVSGSYAFKLSVRDSVKCRRLIASPWYQSLWGHRFSLLSDSNQKIRFGNTRGGERIVTAVDGGITGEGGNIIIIDDPNNAKEVLSEATIEATNEDWWDGTMSTRLNDPKTGAYIVIQQRLGESDLTGHILSKPSGKDWTHLMLPAEYEPQRSFVTSIGWQDPRTEPGELLWPERMGAPEIASLKADLGSWRSAGQLQQRPEPAGGGIIKREHWQLWPPEGEPTDNFGRITKPAAYPAMDYILASLDSAFTEKTMNDESALTIWGVFSGDTVTRDLKTSQSTSTRITGEASARVMLMYCWHGRLELHDLVNEVAKHCKTYRVDKILIENKASGISVAQEMRRLFSTEGFAIQLNDPGNVDKLARLYSVQNIFEEGQVYAPERQWSEDVIAQCGTFPNAKHDDIVDTVSQALRHLRDMGLIVRPAERLQELNESLQFGGRAPAPLYPA